MRNLKAVMLSALALFVVGAAAAQAAEFHTSAAPVKIKSAADGTAKNSHHVFDAAGGSITCSGAESSFTGTVSTTTTSSITITPSYKGCTFLGLAAEVNMGGCDYVFNSNGTVEIGGAPCNIVFRSGAGMTLCQVTVPGGQVLPNAVTYNNINEKKEVTLEAHATGIHWISEGPNCPLVETNTNGNYTTGNTLVKGFTDDATESQVSVWWE